MEFIYSVFCSVTRVLGSTSPPKYCPNEMESGREAVFRYNEGFILLRSSISSCENELCEFESVGPLLDSVEASLATIPFEVKSIQIPFEVKSIHHVSDHQQLLRRMMLAMVDAQHQLGPLRDAIHSERHVRIVDRLTDYGNILDHAMRDMYRAFHACGKRRSPGSGDDLKDSEIAAIAHTIRN